MRYSWLLLLLLSPICWADDALVSLTLTGVGNNTWGSDYAYPYTVSVSDNAAVDMMCDAYTQAMAFNDVWAADANVLTAGNENGILYFSHSTDFANTTDPVTAYNEGAYIFLGVAEGNIDPIYGNMAVWSLFDTSLNASLTGATATAVSGILSTALGQGNAADSSVIVYTPLPPTDPRQNDPRTPQEFFALAGASTTNEGAGSAPEPASLVLLAGGGGLLAAIGASRRRRR
jgi:hypothetical protein